MGSNFNARGIVQGAKKVADSDDSRGAYFPDGSYDPQASWVFRKGTDRFVKHLVAKRRKGELTTEQACKEIEEAGAQRAFPNVKAWLNQEWQTVYCSTSAEEAVKRAGHGSKQESHWCDGNWLQGKEKECHNPRHRDMPTPEDVARITDTLRRAFE